MQVWPAIDVRGGKCVRLSQGDFQRVTTYGDDLQAIAQRWIDAGARRLHLVDLDAALGRGENNLGALAALIQGVSVAVQVGGGIRSREVIERLLEAGAAQLVCGTRAIEEPDWFAEMAASFPHRLVLGLDARDGKVAVRGWTEATSRAASDVVRQVEGLPLAAIAYTDIARDGMLQGPNLASLAEIVEVATGPVIASGGIARLDDVRGVAETGAAGCIIGRALYEDRLKLSDVLEYELERGHYGQG